MPRPNKPRTIGAEDAARVNIERWLAENDRTAAWLARKMTEEGCPIAATGTWAMLRAGRKIHVEELLAVSTITGLSISELVAP